MNGPVRVDHALIEALEADRITVALAALLLAVDASGWSDKPIPDEELAPFLTLDERRPDDWGVWRRVQSWIDIEPVGTVRAARDAIQLRLSEDIEKGRLYAIRVRRHQSGAINPSETQLHHDDLDRWITENGLEPVDNWNQYWEDESQVLEAAIEAARLARTKLRYGERLADTFTGPPTYEELEAKALRLTAENVELRRRGGDGSKPAATGQEPRSAIVLIGALVELVLGSTPNGLKHSRFDTQAAVIDALLANFPHTRGLSKRTVEDLFAKGKRALRQASG